MECQTTVDSPNGPMNPHQVMDELHLYPFLDYDEDVHGFPLDTMMHYHLTSNHFPPVHPSFIQTAKDALEHARSCDG